MVRKALNFRFKHLYVIFQSLHVSFSIRNFTCCSKGKDKEQPFSADKAMRRDIWDTVSTSITSIYFDSRDDLTLYKDRIARIESAQLFRARWYNDKPSGEEHIFLELKTHHEQWVLNESVKERVAIQAKDFRYVLLRDGKTWNETIAKKLLLAAKPNLSGDELATATDLLLRIRKLIIKKNLQPCVRSSYRRLAFQSNTNNSLRFTIDRDIELSSEIGAQLGHWCRPSKDTHVSKVMIPISVFEVKLNGVDAPEWVSTLLAESKILDGHKFSKYLSGASMLYEDKVPILPYWAEDPIFISYYNNMSNHSRILIRNDESKCLSQRLCAQKDVEVVTFSSDEENQNSDTNGSMILRQKGHRRPFLNLLNFRKRIRLHQAQRKNVVSKDRVRIEVSYPIFEI
jgi:SPX domain protein involved in polyphosphate accumulation